MRDPRRHARGRTSTAPGSSPCRPHRATTSRNSSMFSVRRCTWHERRSPNERLSPCSGRLWKIRSRSPARTKRFASGTIEPNAPLRRRRSTINAPSGGYSSSSDRSVSRPHCESTVCTRVRRSESAKPRSSTCPTRTSSSMRDSLAAARRIVVKVGTTSLTRGDGSLNPLRIDTLVDELCELLDDAREIVCVTSGAIGAGLGPLGFKTRPKDMPSLQAAAAVGQSHLMDAYNSAFERRGRVCAQVLVTRSDFVHRQQYVNALNTFSRLLALRAVPVVNENDTVATDEIRFGENDLLAALVANLVRADLLVMLSDVDGLHSDGTGPIVGEVDAITPDIEKLAGGSASGLGSGGMRSKLDAVRIAVASGVPAVIAGFRRGALTRILGGRDVGTVVVDAGARHAIVDLNRSLLAAGVKGTDGSFLPGDAVDIVDEDGRVFARGLVGFSSEELGRVDGMDSARVSEVVGDAREVVHRDELVVLVP